MAQRDSYTFENQSSVPAPLDKILPAFFRSWDDATSKDDTYLDIFAPDGELVFRPAIARSREEIRALREGMVHHEKGPVVALQHRLGKCFVLPGDDASNSRKEVISTGSISYHLKNGRQVDAGYSSSATFEDQGNGDCKATHWKVYLDSFEILDAIKEMNEEKS